MPNEKQTNILLVDDKPENLLVLEVILKDLGHNLIRAQSGKEALKQVLNNDFALILLDIDMPIMDGFETATIIRKRANSQHTPIIFITAATGNDKDALKGYSLGAVDFIFKPIVPVILRSKVSVLVDLYKKTKEVERLYQIELQQQEKTYKTTLKLLRDGEEQYSVLVDNIEDYAILRLDPDGYISSWNPGAKKIKGYNAEEILGQHFSRFCIAEDIKQGKPAKMLETASIYGHAHEEGWRVRNDGTTFFASVSITALRNENGELRGFINVTRDISEQKKSEELLRNSEAQYRLLFENNPQSMWIYDPETLAFLAVNNAAIRHYGYTREEFLQMTLKEIRPPEDLIRLLDMVADSTSEMHTENIVQHRKKDGTIIFVEITCHTIHFEGKQARFVLANDITNRKIVEDALKNKEAQLRRLVESNIIGVIFLDFDGRIFDANDAFLKLVGYSKQDLLLGKVRWDTMTPPEYQPLDEKALEELSQFGSCSAFEKEFIRKDGSRVPILFAAATFEGIPNQGICFVLDLTEQKQFDEVLLKERALLAKRVEERTADLSLANAELERVSRLKDEFLASMSHELRTPLNAILGLSEALEEGVYGHLNERQLETLTFIKDSGTHLLNLINDILDLSKIEAGKFEIVTERVDIEPICQSSLAFIKQAAQKKNLKVSSTFDNRIKTIEVDARRLKQILVNLLTNAVKFTPENGTIGLEVNGNVEKQEVQFVIWDTGIGIAEEDLSKLFLPFVQLDSKLSRQQTGTGLGLVLVYKMVELHGGSVSVESTKGKGSRFTISLSWQAEITESARASMDEDISVNLNRLNLQRLQRALIIEDSQTSADQLVRYLDEVGIKTSVHSSNNGVIKAIVEFKPDIILLDLLLPEPAGWNVLTTLKADPRFQSIPIIIISVIDEKAQGLELGAAGYLVKPITRQQLQSALSKIALVAGVANELAPLAPPISHSQENGAKPTLILLVEDNSTNIKTLSDYLLMKEYKIIVARNGIEAIERAKEVSPDIILMDIQMPVMDGLEATRLIKEDTDLVNIPIIALTALVMPGDRDRCLQAGADFYLSKPVNLKLLAKTIEELLAKNGNDRL